MSNKVLIVEENHALAELWAGYLRRHGLDPAVFIDNRTEVKDLVAWGVPAAIICGIEVGKEPMPGAEFCRQIYGPDLKEQPPPIPVIHVYSSLLPDQQQRLFSTGLFQLLRKPVSVACLFAAVQQAIAQAGGATPVAPPPVAPVPVSAPPPPVSATAPVPTLTVVPPPPPAAVTPPPPSPVSPPPPLPAAPAPAPPPAAPAPAPASPPPVSLSITPSHPVPVPPPKTTLTPPLVATATKVVTPLAPPPGSPSQPSILPPSVDIIGIRAAQRLGVFAAGPRPARAFLGLLAKTAEAGTVMLMAAGKAVILTAEDAPPANAANLDGGALLLLDPLDIHACEQAAPLLARLRAAGIARLAVAGVPDERDAPPPSAGDLAARLNLPPPAPATFALPAWTPDAAKRLLAEILV